jgi:hypothetical protein
LGGIFFNLTFPFHAIPGINRFLPALHFRNINQYLITSQVGWVTGSCFMIRKDVYEQIGGLDENIFMYVEETEYCKRTHDIGWQVWYLADEYIWHLERGSSISGNEGAILGIYKGLKYYFKKHKPGWQVNFLIWLLRIGALMRMPMAPKIYWKAFQAV